MRYTIKAGPPARVSTVEFHDDSGFSPQHLMKVSGWRPHMYLTSARVERGLGRLHQFYITQGRLQANINIQQRVYNAPANTEKVIVKAEGGPLVRVRVQGARISTSQLETLLPFYHDGITDDPAMARSERILEDHFQQHGYFSASVKAQP